MRKFEVLIELAKCKGLVLTEESRTMDGERFRYAVANNLSGVEDLCRNLKEVHESIMDLTNV